MSSENNEIRVRSAARAFDILTLVAQSADGRSVPELVEDLGVSRQSIYHLLHTLEHINVLRKNPRRRYTLGPALLPVVSSFLRQYTPQEILAPVVTRLAEETGEAAYAAAWIGNDVTVVASAAGAGRIRSDDVSFGTLGNAHARASGKLLLSMLTDREVADFLEQNPLTPRTPNTITDRAKFWEEIELIRENGYALDRAEYTSRSHCIAIPFHPIPNHALAISSNKFRFEENFDRYLAVMRKVGSTM
ncbi:IclR family transcriptional regulator [Ruegeria jejuensis]|uniref:IclR family transcriptional regulator n=1 Tax=Ruegeria jejuensis TaxID=3233338 RepID=UPI00355B9AE3